MSVANKRTRAKELVNAPWLEVQDVPPAPSGASGAAVAQPGPAAEAPSAAASDEPAGSGALVDDDGDAEN